MIKISATVNSPLDALAAHIQNEMGEVVRKAAFKIEADAAALAPVDTGALRASIFTVTASGSTRGRGMGSARRKRPGLGEARFTETVDDQFEAFVVVGAEYGIYQELGARGRPGKFYMTQAGARNRSWFEDMVRRVITGGPA